MPTASELAINTTVTADDLWNEILGDGVTLVGGTATFSGGAEQAGIYSGAIATLEGISPTDTGVILSTGNVADFTNTSGDANVDPDTATDTSGGIDGDADMNSVAGQSTFDGAIMEAQFIPTGDTLTIQMVFSSEEYLEYVNGGVNDSLGVFVNGVKVDFVLGSGNVSIDDINDTSNANLYLDNPAGSNAYNTEMDGLTKVLTFKADVNAGVTNTIKIGIADGGDSDFDSNVLIMADSMQSVAIANDDVWQISASSTAVFDPLANDDDVVGNGLTITQIDGVDVAPGGTVTLGTGEQITLNADNTFTITSDADITTSAFTYTVDNGAGTTDVGIIQLETVAATAPDGVVEGTTGSDTINASYAGDPDGDFVDNNDAILPGTTGDDDSILGFGGDDSILAGFGNDTVDGGAGNDTILGGAGADTLLGGIGNDSLVGNGGGATGNYLDGGAGDDTLLGSGGIGTNTVIGGDGSDYIISAFSANELITGGEGGADNDTISVAEADDAVVITYTGDEAGSFTDDDGEAGTFTEIESWNLTSGNDVLDGSADGAGIAAAGNAGTDSLTGGSGDDTFDGGTGSDSLTGGGGADSLVGGTDTDTLFGNAGADTLVGGDGADSLDGDGGNDSISGGIGNDIIIGDAGDDTAYGGDGDDQIYDSTGANQFFGEAGNDSIYGGADSDTIAGGTGADYLVGNGGADSLLGGDSNDRLFGNAGDDTLVGGDGADSLDGDEGNDSILGGTGNDTLIGNGGADSLLGGDGIDIVYAGGDDDIVQGGTGDDDLWGETGNDLVDGGEGSDDLRVRENEGTDTIVGGEGGTDNDRLVLNETGLQGVTVTMTGSEAGAYAFDSGNGDGTFTEVEAVLMTNQDDTFDGSAISTGMGAAGFGGDDSLVGGAGDDTFQGDQGSDTFEGGEGADQLSGGDDADLFVLSDTFGNDAIYGGEGVSTGADFDTIDLSAVTVPLTVTFTGDESGTITDGTDTISFYEIENFVLGDQADIVVAPNPATAPITLDAGGGDDTVEGGLGADSLTGNTGADSLTGAAGNDTLSGGAGDDTLWGNLGDDQMLGGDDMDTFLVTDDNDGDTITGGEGGIDWDQIVFSNFATTQGVDVQFTGDESGTYDFVDAGATGAGQFTETEQIVVTEHDDTINAASSSVAHNFFGQGGDDSIIGGSSVDSIEGGSGNDTLAGGLGQDTILGGDGADSVSAGGDTDSVEGGIGDDWLSGNSGDDTVSGGDGADSVFGAEGNDSLLGGGGNDSMEGWTGNDTMMGGLGDDYIDGAQDDDSLEGGDGNDTLLGGSLVGADTLDGGDGNDSLSAGDGDDSLTGGTGNDTLFGSGGNDTFRYADGDGADTIGDFNAGNTGTLSDGDSTNNDFIDLSAFYDDIWELQADQADDGVLNQSNTTTLQGKAVDYADNASFGSGSLTFTGAAADGSFYSVENTNVACFTPGTRIKTAAGEMDAADIATGVSVLTRDNGYQRVCWAGRRRVSGAALQAHPDLRPVRIAKGALGRGRPERDMLVSPQHRVTMDGPSIELLFGEEEVLVAARHLVGRPGIERVCPEEGVTYVHFMFDRHELVMSDGAWTESFQPGDQTLAGLDAPQRAELLALFPELASLDGQAQYASARPGLRGYQARVLATMAL